MALLTIFMPQGNQRIHLADYNTIGRLESNLIQVLDMSISKEHAVITIDKFRHCAIQDCGSTNGTFVNDRKITDKTYLFSGDNIRLGNVLCSIHVESQPLVNIVEEPEGPEESLSNTTFLPCAKSHFVPEYEINDDKILREDYEKLRVTYELQKDLSLGASINQILEAILDRTSEFLCYDQGVILLAEKNGKMVPHSYKTLQAGNKPTIPSTLIQYVKKNKCGIICSDTLYDDLFNDSDSIILQGIKSTIASPILNGDELLGIMVLSSHQTTNAFTDKDLNLISNIANQTAQIIKNSLLHEELSLSFESSIRTLSAIVDARHPLTAGHSSRVTDYSLFLAKEMQLSEKAREILKFAALLHDIGKIGIRDDVLLKNGPFNKEDRRIMDTHPIKTREILDNFRFPAALKKVPKIAACHHEKMNGEGYPSALSGREIPLTSKIIAVADVFDALTAKRDYPKYTATKKVGYAPLPIPEVIKILKEGSGSHFDEKVLNTFLECLPKLLEQFKGVHFPPEYFEKTGT